MRIIIVAVMLQLTAFSATAEALQKQPLPTNEGQPPAGKTQGRAEGSVPTAKDQQGSDSPGTVRPATQSQEQQRSTTEGSHEDSELNANSEAALTRYTFWLMVFTGVLAVSTIALWWSTKKSASALPLIERAYISVEIRNPRGLPPSINDDAFSYDIEIGIANLGRTPAALTLLRAAFAIQDQPPAELITFQGSDRPLPAGMLVGSDYTEHVPVKQSITMLELEQIHKRQKRLYCYGVVKYLDVIKQERATGFCRELQIREDGHRFVPVPGTSLNFTT